MTRTDIVELHKIVIALSRVVVKIEQKTNDDDHEWFDVQTSKDVSTIREYLKKNGED